jgi:hypothetical protein
VAAGRPPGVPYIADGGNFVDAGVIADNPVVYFNCAIPGAMELCADGVKDGQETDIDCGGPQQASTDMCGQCPARCETGQMCLCDADCDGTAGLKCLVNMGALTCQVPAPDAGAGTDPHDHCSWPTDGGLPCTVTPTTAAGTGGGSGTGGASGTGGGTGGA